MKKIYDGSRFAKEREGKREKKSQIISFFCCLFSRSLRQGKIDGRCQIIRNYFRITSPIIFSNEIMVAMLIFLLEFWPE